MSYEAFNISNDGGLEQKLGLFRNAGAKSVHLLLDFDRTITTSINGEDDCTVWQVLHRHLPAAGQAKYAELYSTYRPLEAAGTMTETQAIAWPSAVLDLFAEYKVNLGLIEKDFFNVVTLRPGVAELFKLCEQEGIPVVILSAGIRNVIDLLLRMFDVSSSLTIATELEVDKDETIIGWQPESLVHTFNKSESGHAELEEIRRNRPNCLLIGDSQHDADMTDGEDTVLRIRIFDPRSDEKKDIEDVKRETLQRFDMMTVSKSFAPISKLLETIIGV